MGSKYNPNEIKHEYNGVENPKKSLKKYLSKRPFPCKICHEKCSTAVSLSNHLKLHHPEENQFACNRCDQVMTAIDSYKIHVNHHIVTKPFKCTVCPSTFSEIRSLNRHLTLHSKIKEGKAEEVLPDKSTPTQKYECGECYKLYSNDSHLVKHMINVHKAKLACPICHEASNTIGNMKIHFKFHSEKLLSASKIYGKIISKTVRMDLLKEWHADDKPYMCRYCRDRFVIPSQLKLHQLVHTGGKPFICICGKSYTVKGIMQNHLKRCNYVKESKMCYKRKKRKGRRSKKNNEKRDECHVETLFVKNNELMQEPYKVRWKNEEDETTEFIYEIYEPEKCTSKIDVEPTEPLTTDSFDEPIIEPKEEPEVSLLDPFDDPFIEPKKEPSDEMTIEPKEELNDELSIQSDGEPCAELTNYEPSDEFTKDGLSDDVTITLNNELNINSLFRDKPSGESTDKIFVKKTSAQKRGNANKLIAKVKPNSCDQFNRSFLTKVKLLKHRASHTRAGRFPFSCDVCPKKFAQEWRFQKHVNLIHGVFVKVINKYACGLKCKVCQDCLADEDRLEAHVMEMHPERSIYPCKRCSSSFSDSINLKKHVIKHHPDLNPLECNKCDNISGKTSNWKRHLLTHLKSQNKPKPFICDYCSKQFTAKVVLERHLKGHRELVCAVCGASFLDRSLLRAHRKATKHCRRRLGTSSYICDACGKRFKNKYGIIIHLKKLHTPRESNCNVCGEKLFDRFQEKAHQKRHSIPKPAEEPKKQLTVESKDKLISESIDKSFVKKHCVKKRRKANQLANKVKCKTCGLQFGENYIKTHMTLHKTKSIKCDQCGSYFETKLKLLDHQASHARTERSCDLCPKKFTTEWRLRYHVKRIHGITYKTMKKQVSGLKCEACQDSFPDEDRLEAHVMEMHPERSIYPCKRCPSSFSDSINLYRHMIKHHPNLNPLECNKCNSVSGQTSNWKAHLITHLESEKKPKPFICDYCSSQFTAKGALKRHIKTHIKRLTDCAVCGESFPDRMSLKAHKIAAKHDGRRLYTKGTFICDVCGKKYTHKDTIKLHLIKFHTPRESNCNICGEKLFDKFQEKTHQKRHAFTHDLVELGIIVQKRHSSTNDLGHKATSTKLACHKCGKILSSKQTLVNHLKLHDDIKPYQCAQCGKRFVSVWRLHLHAAVHEEEKAYICQGCSRAFSQKGNLKAHLKLCGQIVDYSEKNIAVESHMLRKKVVVNENITPHDTIMEPNLIQDRATIETMNKEETFDIRFIEEMKDEQNNEVFEYSLRDNTFKYNAGINHTFRPEITLEKKESSNDGSYFDPGGKSKHSSSQNESHETHKEETKEEVEDSMNDPYVEPEVYLEDPLDKSGEDTCRQENIIDVPAVSEPRDDKPDVNAGGQKFTCDICNTQVKHFSTLKRHMKMHSEGKIHQCQTCGHAFHQLYNLKSHQRTHSGQESLAYTLPCYICSRKFNHKKRLKEHIQLVHFKPPPGDRFVCKTCGKSYKAKATLRIHLRNHTGERPYICHVCGRSFTKSGLLKVHLRTHTGEGKVNCDQCGKTCSSKLTLSQHIFTHREKTHACHLCEKKFCRKSLLKIHLKRHAGIKTHKCKFCEKAFVGTGNLNRHMEVHADMEPQKCEICNKVFSRTFYLKRHMRIHKKSIQKKIS